jgi:hypothetical protein
MREDNLPTHLAIAVAAMSILGPIVALIWWLASLAHHLEAHNARLRALEEGAEAGEAKRETSIRDIMDELRKISASISGLALQVQHLSDVKANLSDLRR